MLFLAFACSTLRAELAALLAFCSLGSCARKWQESKREKERAKKRGREIARVAISLGLGRQKVKRATRRMRYINYDTIG